MAPNPSTMAFLNDAFDLIYAWRVGLTSSEAVVEWADHQIAATLPEDLPEWLLDLSMYGPDKCMRRPSRDFIEVPTWSFERALAIRARLLNVEDDAQIEQFVRWVSRACMGHDLDARAVQFGYELEHVWGDCDRMDLAVQLVRTDLAAVVSTLPTISDDVIRALRGNCI
jgi:hypothetical protein